MCLLVELLMCSLIRFALCVSFMSVAFAILATVPAWAEFELVDGPRADDAMAVHTYRLDNGLTVFLTENHEEPRFYMTFTLLTPVPTATQESTWGEVKNRER